MKYLVGFLIVAGVFFYLGATSEVQNDVRIVQKNAKRTVTMIQERAN